MFGKNDSSSPQSGEKNLLSVGHVDKETSWWYCKAWSRCCCEEDAEEEEDNAGRPRLVE